jgi:hypothetical protein
VELQPADTAAGDEPPRLAYRLLAPMRVQADEGERDIRVLSREVQHRVVPDRRPPGEPFVDREHDTGHAPTAVVLGEGAPIRVDRAGEVLAGRSGHRTVIVRWVQVNVQVDCRQSFDVERERASASGLVHCGFSRQITWGGGGWA